MKIVVVQLPEHLHDYLLEVQRRHAHAGIEPEELAISAQLWEATTKKATVVSTDPPAQPAAEGEAHGPEQSERSTE